MSVTAREGGADDGTEAGVFRDNEIHIEHTVKGFEDLRGLRYGGKVAGEDNVAKAEIACGENADHTNGLEYHIDYTESAVCMCGEIADVSEIGSGHKVLKAGGDVVLCKGVDLYVNVSDIAALGEIVDVVHRVHPEKLF